MIDEARLKDLQLIMKEDFSDLIEIFIEDSVSRSNALKNLLSENPINAIQVKNNAHTLKGSSGNVFATRLQDLYFTLEQLAAELKLHQIGDLMEDIEDETQIVFEELRNFNSNLNL